MIPRRPFSESSCVLPIGKGGHRGRDEALKDRKFFSSQIPILFSKENFEVVCARYFENEILELVSSSIVLLPPAKTDQE